MLPLKIIRVNQFLISSWADPEGEDLALTLINHKLLDNFTDLPEYKGLKGKFDIKGGGFADLPVRVSGEFNQKDQTTWINKKLRGDVFKSISPNAPDVKLSSLDIEYLYAQLHEDLHGLVPGKYKKESIETVLEETITGSLSRLYLRDFITSNKLKFDEKMVKDHFDMGVGYEEKSRALQVIVGYLGKDFKQYCLELKMARTTKARIEMLKRDYKSEFYKRMRDNKIEQIPDKVDDVIDRLFEDFDKEELYNKPQNVNMLIDTLDTFLQTLKRGVVK